MREATWENQGFRFPVTRNPAKEKLFIEVRNSNGEYVPSSLIGKGSIVLDDIRDELNQGRLTNDEQRRFPRDVLGIRCQYENAITQRKIAICMQLTSLHLQRAPKKSSTCITAQRRCLGGSRRVVSKSLSS